ncbi:MAG: O-antigen ligase family protein [bacterium]|nr:O-antigen ligase family protein [bacterium]
MNKQIPRNIILVGLFLVPFVPFLVSSSLFFPFITTKAFTWRIIVEIVFAVWVLLALYDVDSRPKKSVILYAVVGFLVIVGVADLFGVAPVKSFWSNFERMEGFITLLHLGMFFVVTSSVFREIDWKRWWNVSLVASFLMVLYCILQIIGLRAINQGGVRVDGTLGNAIYLAVYMLFHIFIALLFLWREWKNVALRWVYGLLILSQAFILYQTATRGAILGLIGGIFIMAVLNLANKEDKLVRRASAALLVGLVVLVGGFMLFKDRNFIQNSPILSRFSSLTTEAIKTQGRYFVWPMAVKGFQERPLLGWGQDNFNYVFNQYYDPQMFNLEPWFDRAHNIFLDWMVAGGLLGLVSYLALYVALLFSIWKYANLSHTEKSVLTGLVATYFFHNFFVFDNLISYTLFFSLLAYVHYRNNGGTLWGQTLSDIQVKGIALPVVSILLILSLYFANIKPIITNIFIIKALQSLQTSGQVPVAVANFKKAYNASRLGRPEVAEHIAANSIAILSSGLSMEEKNAFFSFAKDVLLGQTDDLNGDARYELLAGSFLSTVGLLDEALTHLEVSRALMPGKQQVYFEIGAAYINKKEPLKALDIFREAYELAPEYTEARVIYLVGAIYAGDKIVESKIMNTLTEREVIFDDRILNAYYANGRTDRVRGLLGSRIKLDPAKESIYRQYLEKVAN